MILTEQQAKQQRKNRLQLIAILAIVIIPVVGSTFMYYTGIGMPTATSNKGILITPPITLTDMELQTDDGQHWSWLSTGNFRLALLLNGECDGQCEELLHNIRQVHVRLAKRAGSVERWLLQFDYTAKDAQLINNYPHLTYVRSDLQAWRERLVQNKAIDMSFTGHQIALLDRRGNLIMMFNPDQSGQDLLDDLNFLIKSTQ